MPAACPATFCARACVRVRRVTLCECEGVCLSPAQSESGNPSDASPWAPRLSGRGGGGAVERGGGGGGVSGRGATRAAPAPHLACACRRSAPAAAAAPRPQAARCHEPPAVISRRHKAQIQAAPQAAPRADERACGGRTRTWCCASSRCPVDCWAGCGQLRSAGFSARWSRG